MKNVLIISVILLVGCFLYWDSVNPQFCLHLKETNQRTIKLNSDIYYLDSYLNGSNVDIVVVRNLRNSIEEDRKEVESMIQNVSSLKAKLLWVKSLSLVLSVVSLISFYKLTRLL